jgi:hypothetical protein
VKCGQGIRRKMAMTNPTRLYIILKEKLKDWVAVAKLGRLKVHKRKIHVPIHN